MLIKTIRKMKKNKKSIEAEGLMTFGELENGLKTMDFTSLSDVKMEECTASFKVRAMRDGNVYMTQVPRRPRNRALFRDDNASLSLGRNGRFYFVFTLPEEMIDDLPTELVRQAGAIANKVRTDLKLSVKRIKK
jgi:hypothetical protein